MVGGQKLTDDYEAYVCAEHKTRPPAWSSSRNGRSLRWLPAPLGSYGPLSLTVAVAEGSGPDGTAYVTLDPIVSHRGCRDPGLT